MMEYLLDNFGESQTNSLNLEINIIGELSSWC